VILLTLHQGLLSLNSMAKLNQIKAILAEQRKTSTWLAEQVGKSACTVSGAVIALSRICIHLKK
jgi:hypothetical protein